MTGKQEREIKGNAFYVYSWMVGGVFPAMYIKSRPYGLKGVSGPELDLGERFWKLPKETLAMAIGTAILDASPIWAEWFEKLARKEEGKMEEVKKVQLEVTRNELVFLHQGLMRLDRYYQERIAMGDDIPDVRLAWQRAEDSITALGERIEKILQETPYEGYV